MTVIYAALLALKRQIKKKKKKMSQEDSITKILTVKREEFRKQLRDKRLKEQFQEKRQHYQSQQQLNNTQITSSTSEDESDFNQMQLHFDSESERVNFSRKRFQKQYSVDSLRAIIKQLKKEKQIPYHFQNYESYCENLAAKTDIKDQYIIALLSEAIYFMGNSNKYSDKIKPFNQLMSLYYNYQNFTTFQYIEAMVLSDLQCQKQLDLYCKTLQLKCSLIQWLSNNINYANLHMILLILKMLANSDLVEAFKFYGLMDSLNRYKGQAEYKKTIQKIKDKIQPYLKPIELHEESSISLSVTN